MHRTVRMLAILLELQNGATTIGALSETFECSRKTIQRDISALVDLQLPVISSAGANGGISIDPAWTLSPMNLTPEEIETTILALENARHLPASEQTLTKIRNAAKPVYFDAVALDPQRPMIRRTPLSDMPDGVNRVRKVMQRNLWCRFDYSGGSQPGWRLVLPEALHIAEGRWYLRAIDERSRANRVFRVDRIRDIVPALAPNNADEIVTAARAQPDYDSDVFPEVVVDLTPAGLAFCRDHSHFHHVIVNDQLRFRCPPTEYLYLARELVRMDTDCRVISPPVLIQTMQNHVAKIATHLGNNQDVTVS